MKVLAGRAELTPPLAELATSHLTDSDPFVRRAAAEVLGAHPCRPTSGPCSRCGSRRPRMTRT